MIRIEVDIDIKGYNDLWDPSLEDSIALDRPTTVLSMVSHSFPLGESMNEEDVDAD